MTTNIYQVVTDRILAQMEQGIIPWHKPWTTLGEGGAINYVTRRPYSFLNQMLLGLSGEWLTFKQAKSCGGNIKQGEKASVVVYYQMVEKKEINDKGEEEIKSYPVLKYYHVFHISQCEGIESKMQTEDADTTLQPQEKAENIIFGYVSRKDAPKYINNQPSDQAYYQPSTDTVVVPMLSQYNNVNEYYSTNFHELIHSTGHKSRLDRLTTGKASAFGGEDYSREELVAEIGSAMLCNLAGIDCDKAFKNSVAYIQGWSKHLAHDPKAIVIASAKAEKAAKYILNETEK